MTDALLEKIPPQNIEAEQSTLGAMLLEREAIAKAEPMLQPDGADFYRQAHQLIYRSILELYRKNDPVDSITLGALLRDRGLLDEIGGGLYLNTLMSTAPTAAGVRNYVKIVLQKSRQRQLITAADEIMTAAYADYIEDIDALQESAESRILAVGQRRQRKGGRLLRDSAKDAFYQLETELDGAELRGFKTGWKGVNTIMSHCQPGHLTVIGARPGMGKTAFALNWALSLAADERPGYIFSLEMPEEELALRSLLAQVRGFSQNELDDYEYRKANKKAILEDFSQAVDDLWKLPIGINDDPDMTVQGIDAELRRWKAEHGPLEYCMVDFLQLVKREGGRSQSEQDKIEYLIQELAKLAKRQRLHVIALSQLNRKVEEETIKRPALHHFLGSGAIETYAYRALYLYRPAYYGEGECERNNLDYELHNDYMEVGTLKQRGGGTSVNKNGRQIRETYLHFQGENSRFCDLSANEWAALSQRRSNSHE